MSAPIQVIGGRTYSFGTIPPLDAVDVEIAIASVIGEPLFRMFMDHKKTGNTPEEEQAAMASAIGLLMSKMNKALLRETLTTVFSFVGVDGRARIDINSDFMGRNKELWLVFIAALRHNFSDFLPESLLNSMQGKIQAASV